MSKHTPVPWRVGEDDEFDGYPFIVIEAGEICTPTYDRVAEVCSSLIEVPNGGDKFEINERNRANAAHIVKCVNSYDNLIFVLETVESYLRTGQSFISQAGIDNMLTLIREQLAKAEGRGA